MSEPVYVYYELRNYYQNHIKYVKSRDNPQLRGEDRSKSEVSTCDPVKMNDDLYTPLSFYGVALDMGNVANPCGLAALTTFNGKGKTDSFSLSMNETMIKIDDDDIAWQNDVKVVYSRADNYKEEQWIDVEDGKV
jgi:hypothetical protein